MTVHEDIGSRRPVVHSLKIWPEFINDIGKGVKTFEVRKNDRDFRVGDLLELREYDPATKAYRARSIVCRITYVLTADAGFGLIEGWCVLGIELPTNHSWPE
jgi:hypothetical protein